MAALIHLTALSLAAVGLWGVNLEDEPYSRAVVARIHTDPESVPGLLAARLHAPFAYLVFSVFTEGTTESSIITMRAISIFQLVLALGCVFWIAKQLDRSLAAPSLTLSFAAPPMWAFEARGYGSLALSTVATTALALALLKSTSSFRRVTLTTALAAAAIVACYTHVYGWIFVACAPIAAALVSLPWSTAGNRPLSRRGGRSAFGSPGFALVALASFLALAVSGPWLRFLITTGKDPHYTAAGSAFVSTLLLEEIARRLMSRGPVIVVLGLMALLVPARFRRGALLVALLPALGTAVPVLIPVVAAGVLAKELRATALDSEDVRSWMFVLLLACAPPMLNTSKSPPNYVIGSVLLQRLIWARLAVSATGSWAARLGLIGVVALVVSTAMTTVNPNPPAGIGRGPHPGTTPNAATIMVPTPR